MYKKAGSHNWKPPSRAKLQLVRKKSVMKEQSISGEEQITKFDAEGNALDVCCLFIYNIYQ